MGAYRRNIDEAAMLDPVLAAALRLHEAECMSYEDAIEFALIHVLKHRKGLLDALVALEGMRRYEFLLSDGAQAESPGVAPEKKGKS